MKRWLLLGRVVSISYTTKPVVIVDRCKPGTKRYVVH